MQYYSLGYRNHSFLCHIFDVLKVKTRKRKCYIMITRLFYLLIFLTGGMLITDFGAYAVKMIVGIIVIAAMEMVLVRTKKGKSTSAMWTLFIVALVFVLYLGLSLPQGMDFF